MTTPAKELGITGDFRIKSLTGNKWFQFTNLFVYKTADEDKVELSFKDSNGKIITATIIRIITNDDIISQRGLSFSSVTGNARDNRINIYVETQSDPYSFSISNRSDYDSFVSKLENLLERVKEDAKDQYDYHVYASNTKDDPKYTFEAWKKNKDEVNEKLRHDYHNRMYYGGRKTRKRKGRSSTKKHKKNKKRASTKKHKKYKKRKSTRKR